MIRNDYRPVPRFFINIRLQFYRGGGAGASAERVAMRFKFYHKPLLRINPFVAIK